VLILSPVGRDPYARKVIIPRAFGAPRLVREINIAAVGLSLSAVTAGVFGAMSHELSGFVTGLPTLLVGALWAYVLRSPRTIGNSRVRWGWLLSVPLAMANAGLSAGLLMLGERGNDSLSGFVVGIALGATFGIMFWGPALVFTLLAFGLPIARAQKLAKKGLAGEERGEWIIGGVCVLLGALGLALSFFQEKGYGYYQGELLRTQGALFAGHVFQIVTSVLGLVAGSISTVLAQARESKRRAFVKKAEAGEIRGFRVDPTPEGKVLVRVSPQGQGYRVADFSEEVFLLDEEGRATEARAAELSR
jgi:hypothetical protein